jgi:hypothetical protein
VHEYNIQVAQICQIIIKNSPFVSLSHTCSQESRVIPHCRLRYFFVSFVKITVCIVTHPPLSEMNCTAYRIHPRASREQSRRRVHVYLIILTSHGSASLTRDEVLLVRVTCMHLATRLTTLGPSSVTLKYNDWRDVYRSSKRYPARKISWARALHYCTYWKFAI